MDTRSKNSLNVRRLLSAAVLCVCAAVMLAFYPTFEKAGREEAEEVYEGAEYLSEMLSPVTRGNYVLYNEISRDEDESQIREELETSDFRRLEKYMDYSFFDDEGEALLESRSGVAGKLDGQPENTAYDIQISFSFDGVGVLGDIQVSSSYLDKEVQYQIEEALLHDQQSLEREWEAQEAWPISTPVDVTAVYGMTRDNAESYLSSYVSAEAYGGAYVYAWGILESSSFAWVMIFLTLLAAAAGVLYRIFSGDRQEAVFRAPAELVCAAVLGLASAMIWPAIMIWKTCSGELISSSGYANVDRILAYGLNFLVWLVIFAVIFWIGGCLREFFKAPVDYLKERSLLVRWVRWLLTGQKDFAGTVKEKASGVFRKTKGAVKKQYEALLHLDFRDRTNRLILKIVGINFVVILIISLFWGFGVWVLTIYSVLLFLFLRRYLDQVKQQYGQILKTTSTLAEGRLDIPIEGDAGIFAPVQEELVKIQSGFRKAVEREVKSERMKTDLVTNVSHDLKTPLTAIITYVDLLKNEEDEEKRREYIGILERKSQRLKVLIEDLFEISKATSKSVTLHFMDLDIIGLLKQVELEYDRDIKAADLHIRWSLPGEKVILKLDSQKAYRVFENLLVNITKYALPHTRVYIDVEETEQEAVIRMKNVSAAELDFDTEEITDRFVRGDASRNTEGSGLGLAIARSFTELMHGTLQISTEADLFRVEIRFPKP